ncbi:hypothetical protein MK280_04215, partial [Myxococcota bacterium]|nr:hypothetical protein [Myxococcota bacterium]
GEHPSLEIVRRVLVDAVAEQVAEASVETIAMIGEGNRVAAKLRITGETHDGQIYNPKGEPSGSVFGVDSESITEVILFLDNTMIETVLLGRNYVSATQAGIAKNG